MELDNLDRKILYELDENARQSLKAIARKHRTSKEVVNYRLRRMEREGVIKGYYTLFDFSKLGYMLIRVYLKLKNASLEREDEIIGFLARSENTFWVAKTEGSWDVAIGFLVTDFRDFHESWEEVERFCKGNILEKNVSVVFEFVHYRRTYLGVEKRVKNVAGASAKAEIDSKDRTLMEVLSSAGRMPLVEIAKRLGMSPANARYRMRGLENAGVILGYRADVDLGKIGVDYYKVDVEVEDLRSLKEVQAFISANPHVTYEDRTVGGSNLEFDVEADRETFAALVTQIRKMLGENMRYLRYYVSRDIAKIAYYPKGPATHS